VNWFNKHLNWTYLIFFGISIIATAVIITKDQSITYLAIASIVSIIINLAAGGWVLWKKGQSLWWLALLFLMTIVFLIFVLILENRNEPSEKKNAITDEDYYKKRGNQ
jgi:Ca2+/Na+ antiporter